MTTGAKSITFPNGSPLIFGKSDEIPYHSNNEFTFLGFERLMDATKYVRLSANTDLTEEQYRVAGLRANVMIELLHAQLGITTEAGEFADSIKKYILYNKTIDTVNLKEELGDLLWYIALACRELEVPLEEIFEQNIAKLKARYGDKFTEGAALNRDLDNERKVLEGGK